MKTWRRPARYELTLTDRQRAIRGVWVIFDRGRDILQIYGDPEVRAFAQRHDLALLLPFHCRAKSGTDGDLNMDPAKGIGRALFAALDQFAELSGHRELASARLILLGFSGTGSLVGRFAGYAPDRVMAVVATHPGHNPLGLETIDLTPEAAAIPQFILAGSTDRITGTERPYAYFRKYFDRGAPWTFVVQNRTPHCCVVNAKALVLMWLDAVVVQRIRRGSSAERYGFIRTAPETVQGCPNLRPARGPYLVSWDEGCVGRSELVGQHGCHRDASKPAAGNDAGRLAADSWLCEAVAVVRDATGPSGHVPSMTPIDDG